MGANIEAVGTDQRNCLHYAVQHSDTTILQHLLKVSHHDLPNYTLNEEDLQ